MDRLTVPQRSLLMARVKSCDTKPEMIVRRMVFSMGYRYRLHMVSLTGKPDLVFASRKKIIFVHGCFWHRHTGCRLATTPSTNTSYWLPKFARTVERDSQSLSKLGALGWTCLVVWECETKDDILLKAKLRAFLGPKVAY